MKATTSRVTKKVLADNLSPVKRSSTKSTKVFGNKTKEMVLGEDKNKMLNVVKSLTLKEHGLKMSWFLKPKDCLNISNIWKFKLIGKILNGLLKRITGMISWKNTWVIAVILKEKLRFLKKLLKRMFKIRYLLKISNPINEYYRYQFTTKLLHPILLYFKKSDLNII